MAGTIKGITIQIGGDTTGLDKALKGVNAESRNLQSELRNVDRLLKLDPSNVNLLTQKQDLLAKSVSGTRQGLQNLREAQRQLDAQVEDGTITQEQYKNASNSVQNEIVKQTAALKEQETALKKCAPQWETLSAKMVAFGEKATAAGKKLAPLSAAAGGIAAGMAGMAVSAGKTADDLNTLAKQTGLSTEELQKFQYATDLIDVPLETLTGSMAKMIKNMATAQKGTGDAAKAFTELGVRIEDGTGQLRDRNAVFQETINALGRMGNETQRDALAMQIFGRSAQDLNPLIMGGADALKELGDQAEAAGLILSQDALDSANEFNDAIDTLKATAKGTFQAVGTELATALIPVMQDLGDLLKGVMEWVRGLDGNTLKLIATVGVAVAAIAPLLMVIGQISIGLGGIVMVATRLAPALAAVGAALKAAWAAMMANPIALMIAAIAALGVCITAIILKIRDFWKENEEFRNKVIGLWTGVKDWFVDLFTVKIPGALDSMKQRFKDVFDSLVDLAKKPVNGVIGIINKTIDGINSMIRSLNKVKIDIPDWVPLLGGKEFGFKIGEIPKIPQLAKGTLSAQRGLALVGERGPELVSFRGGERVFTAGQTRAALAGTSEVYNFQPGSVVIDPRSIKDLEGFAEVVKGFKTARQTRRAYGQ